MYLRFAETVVLKWICTMSYHGNNIKNRIKLLISFTILCIMVLSTCVSIQQHLYVSHTLVLLIALTTVAIPPRDSGDVATTKTFGIIERLICCIVRGILRPLYSIKIAYVWSLLRFDLSVLIQKGYRVSYIKFDLILRYYFP